MDVVPWCTPICNDVDLTSNLKSLVTSMPTFKDAPSLFTNFLIGISTPWGCSPSEQTSMGSSLMNPARAVALVGSLAAMPFRYAFVAFITALPSVCPNAARMAALVAGFNRQHNDGISPPKTTCAPRMMFVKRTAPPPSDALRAYTISLICLFPCVIIISSCKAFLQSHAAAP